MFDTPTMDLPLAALRQPMLTPDEERELALRTAAGDPAAEQRLITSHLRLVVGLARRYGRFGLPESDLVQEGTVGLIHAARKFDPDRDVRFATYAAWWVRAAIQDHVLRSWSLVRVGRSAGHRMLFFALRRKAAELRTSVDGIGDEILGRMASRVRLSLAEAQGLARRIAGRDQSLDQPSGDDPEGPSLLDGLPSHLPTPEEAVAITGAARLWGAMLDRALSMLPAREAAIIRKRHLTEIPPTFEAIGRELGISKDRVRQLERRALARLREMLQPAALSHGLPGGS
ncbi:sigma-70 family RNA polymerase sigma factor [Arenibaculum pallidiluteum]|uniref:sigma-70 family RNA polymerase sigma factor n=1 Tax=Arenibaculum pallidiluteum TaxID=2812559 RepID=UPI001A9659EB|nr:sigma-70 family RNA polymerase sigma factor [Arenibaculum pallidiluteum]